MINLFGTIIEAPTISSSIFLELTLESVAKRNDERNILRDFLTPRLEEIISQSQVEVSSFSDLDASRPQAIEFYVAQAKFSGVFENLVLKVISQDKTFASSSTASQILSGQKSPQLPSTFPGDHKKAEAIIFGSLSSSVGAKEINEFLLRKIVKQRIQDIAKDMFLGINRGLNAAESVSLLNVLYDLDKIKTADAVPQSGYKEVIINSLKNHQPIPIVHIKSIRFTYPGGNHLQVIENTQPTTQPSVGGGHRCYPSEDIIFTRLSHFRDTLKRHGVESELTVIVSDHDLSYCFPENQKIVPPEEVYNATDSVRAYLDIIRHQFPNQKTFSLTEFLEYNSLDQKYSQTFDNLVFQGEGGGGQHLTEKVLEMRVNGQYEHYSEMFGNYTRDLARYTAIRQIANVLALSVVFESFSSTPLLVIDTRGFEDRLIGGLNPKSVAKFFTKLKDPVEVIK